MWEVKISPSSKEKEKQFKPFVAKYKTKNEAEKAKLALIRIAKNSTIAPCDIETEKEGIVFNHYPWSISEPVLVK